jgi:hypothetical protein
MFNLVSWLMYLVSEECNGDAIIYLEEPAEFV